MSGKENICQEKKNQFLFWFQKEFFLATKSLEWKINFEGAVEFSSRFLLHLPWKNLRIGINNLRAREGSTIDKKKIHRQQDVKNLSSGEKFNRIFFGRKDFKKRKRKKNVQWNYLRITWEFHLRNSESSGEGSNPYLEWILYNFFSENFEF